MTTITENRNKGLNIVVTTLILLVVGARAREELYISVGEC